MRLDTARLVPSFHRQAGFIRSRLGKSLGEVGGLAAVTWHIILLLFVGLLGQRDMDQMAPPTSLTRRSR